MRPVSQKRLVIWAVGNHIPANINPDMIVQYLDYTRKHWALAKGEFSLQFKAAGARLPSPVPALRKQALKRTAVW